MDLWVVAAAAGAGYLAKYWQNVLRDKEGSSGFPSDKIYPDEPQSPSLIERIRDKTCPIKRLSRPRTNIGKGRHSGEILTEICGGNGSVGSEATCSNSSNQEQVVRHNVDNVPPQFMIPPELRNAKRFEDYGDGYALDADMRDIPENGDLELGASHGSRRHKNSLRSRRLHLQYIKPRSSLDSCLVAQLHRERADMEEYLLTPLSSPCTPSLRPFFVTDGKRVISRASNDFCKGSDMAVLPRPYTEVFGVPHLPKIREAEYSKLRLDGGKSQVEESCYPSRKKLKGCRSQMEQLHSRNKLTQFDTRTGLSSGQALFCLGISIGILSTIIANMVELEKLKQRLKQSENLVDDLQEELEMKDSLTVKELANDDDSQDIHGCLSGNEINLFSDQPATNTLIADADEESVCLVKDESISNIEAELEAELERLELSMKGSALPGILADEIGSDQEFDKDMIAEVVRGELQADNLCKRSGSEPTPNRDSHSPTPHSAKDGVSPRDLTLRLHEVIKSRLEDRIMELEAELAKGQKRIQHLTSERSNYWREISHSGSSSSRCSPRAIEALSPVAPPLIMNLSGDALDAYNEAFEELDKLKVSDDKPSQYQDNSDHGTLSSSKIGTDGRQTGLHNSNNTWLPSKGEEAIPISITGIPSSEDSPSDSYNSGDDDDDLLLIKQIVEKARQGSPAILRAQNAMVSLDRGDHYQV